MRAAFRLVWGALGVFIAVQYLFWLCEMAVSYWDNSAWPLIPRVWVFFAVGTTLRWSLEQAFPSLRVFPLTPAP